MKHFVQPWHLIFNLLHIPFLEMIESFNFNLYKLNNGRYNFHGSKKESNWYLIKTWFFVLKVEHKNNKPTQINSLEHIFSAKWCFFVFERLQFMNVFMYYFQTEQVACMVLHIMGTKMQNNFYPFFSRLTICGNALKRVILANTQCKSGISRAVTLWFKLIVLCWVMKNVALWEKISHAKFVFFHFQSHAAAKTNFQVSESKNNVYLLVLGTGTVKFRSCD